jgi:hypothetical protein
MATSTVNASRNDHVISQFIHRGFSTDQATVLVIRRPLALGRYEVTAGIPIKQTAMVRDFNTVELPNHQAVTTLESAIAKHIETPAANALRAIQGAGIGPLRLSAQARRAVCGLAGLFHANSPAGRQHLTQALSTFVPVGGASPAQLRSIARAFAFNRNDAAEVFAWEQIFAFAQVGSTTTSQANLSRLTILLGQMMAASLEKMVITVYRVAAPPYLILPDLPVLGMIPPGGGDIPDPGSFVVFPFEHRHLLVFEGRSGTDEVRDADDPRIDALLRPRFLDADQRITGARRWATVLAINSMSAEAYATRAEDFKEALTLAEPTAAVVMWSSPDQKGPGLAIR